MKKISYQEALASGLKTYFTGKPCKYGHVSDRYVKGCRCAECCRSEARVRVKEWTAKNPERYRKYQKQYREKNKATLRKQARERRRAKGPQIRTEEYREKQNEHRKKRYRDEPQYAQERKKKSAQWRAAFPTRAKEQFARWKAKDPKAFKLRESAYYQNRRARKKAGGKIDKEDVRKIRTARKCAGCGKRTKRMEIDHIVSLKRGGLNHRHNLQPLCRSCNARKSTKDPIQWAQENGRLL